MNKKHVKQFLTYLATALVCTSACATVLVENPASSIPDIEETKITQDIENPENEKDGKDNSEPGISPQNDKDDDKSKTDNTL